MSVCIDCCSVVPVASLCSAIGGKSLGWSVIDKSVEWKGCMVQRKRMGFSGLVVGASIVAMFVVTDALDIGGYSAAQQVDSLAVTPGDSEGVCVGLRDAAKGVMQARQAGAERATVAEVLEPLAADGELILALAYGYPVHEAVDSKEQAVVEFAEGVHSKCLKGVAP